MNDNSSLKPSPLFIDSHCHFDFAQFDEDRQQVWQECINSGVIAAIVPGVDVSQWRKAASLCQQLEGLYYGAGIHPWWVDEFLNTYPQGLAALQEKIVREVQSPQCIAIGECGLDKTINTPFKVQLEIFEYQLKLAYDLNKPVILHSRKAHNELLAILKKVQPARGGVIHGFSGSTELAKQYWSLGCYLGVGGTITYSRANKTRAAIKSMPLESLLLETDAPDMPIMGKQGQRNSPAYIPMIAQALADLKNESLPTIARQTKNNTQNLFGMSELAL
ncbi:TatD family hydrolase [Agarilytica rhodophyticola]|uniref:TatD family hydrolase n=1 Tax=Agarilytica rhodophyticola TaxID=1737490 RepID=UPI000B3469F3|nr:TatD family hydrolase [Agarilytica rhodophyticola]